VNLDEEDGVAPPELFRYGGWSLAQGEGCGGAPTFGLACLLPGIHGLKSTTGAAGNNPGKASANLGSEKWPSEIQTMEGLIRFMMLVAFLFVVIRVFQGRRAV